MIEFKNTDVKIGKRTLLKDAALTINDGEITVILGKNGSGKTTLLSTVFLTRDRGTAEKISIDGTPLPSLSKREVASLVSLMPQVLPTPKMSVRELVELGISAKKGPFSTLTDEEKRRVESAISALGLSDLSDSLVHDLSGGERRRAFFALILAREGKNVILDEPYDSLDPPSRSDLHRFIRMLKEEGRATAIVMHDLSDAVGIADKIYVLDQKRVSRAMTPDEFCSSDIPERVFSSRPYKLSTENGEITVFTPK